MIPISTTIAKEVAVEEEEVIVEEEVSEDVEEEDEGVGEDIVAAIEEEDVADIIHTIERERECGEMGKQEKQDRLPPPVCLQNLSLCCVGIRYYLGMITCQGFEYLLFIALVVGRNWTEYLIGVL